AAAGGVFSGALAAIGGATEGNGAQSFPQPMGHDCKVVHGKAPGPKNIVLCGTHGHILDIDKKQIIAANVNDLIARHPEYGPLPVPMLPDCKVVRGKVPGPKHHVLCGTHGHVLDEEAKQIIAHSIGEYVHTHKSSAQGKPPAAHGTPQQSGHAP